MDIFLIFIKKMDICESNCGQTPKSSKRGIFDLENNINYISQKTYSILKEYIPEKITFPNSNFNKIHTSVKHHQGKKIKRELFDLMLKNEFSHLTLAYFIFIQNK
jgi:hypothetical protein